jgi:hypothetical protein
MRGQEKKGGEDGKKKYSIGKVLGLDKLFTVHSSHFTIYNLRSLSRFTLHGLFIALRFTAFGRGCR